MGLSFVLTECLLQCREHLSCCSPTCPVSLLGHAACIKMEGLHFWLPVHDQTEPWIRVRQAWKSSFFSLQFRLTWGNDMTDVKLSGNKWATLKLFTVLSWIGLVFSGTLVTPMFNLQIQITERCLETKEDLYNTRFCLIVIMLRCFHQCHWIASR